MTGNPARKRRVRLIVSLTVALLLAGALMYTSFGAAHDEIAAGRLLTVARPGDSYQLAGTVVAYRREGDVLIFRVRDPKRAGLVARVRYTGAVPDPFRVGRGDRDRAQAGPRAHRPARLTDHEVPLQVPGGAAR